ncbi:Peroxiredoxin [Rhodanobacter lindaniclasticus]
MCLAVNDAYVMQAWAAAQQVPPGLLMLADGNAEFPRALGLELDGTDFGMGIRARRFALYAEEQRGAGTQLEAPGDCACPPPRRCSQRSTARRPVSRRLICCADGYRQ